MKSMATYSEHILYFVLFLGFFSLTTASTYAEETVAEYTEEDAARLDVVHQFADSVLEYGMDQWSGEDSPLLADGVDVRTHEPVTWRYNGKEYIISNLASQQNLFRTFTGLSNLTDDPRYRRAAEDAVEYHFEHFQARSGLLHWGGHQFIDLRTLQPVGDFDCGKHEFKMNFPFYELMWDVDSEATNRFLRALWNAHVYDWNVLDMNRHGDYNQSAPEGEEVWDHNFDSPDPFFEGDGLTFINAGTDLIYGAGKLFLLGDETSAWKWGRRMARLYVEARHPDTGLGAYQYSKTRRKKDPPEPPTPLTDKLTYSKYGDRAENQFGHQFGEVAREGWVMWGGRIRTIYAINGLVQLTLGESLEGEEGDELIEWTADGLEALAEYSYMPEENAFRPMWADGTDLTGKTYGRTGYYGEKGTEWKPYKPPRNRMMDFLLTYVRAYRLTRRPLLWETARNMASGLGMGDIGSEPGKDVDLTDEGNTPQKIFVLLELNRAEPHSQYVQKARIAADKMVEKRFRKGFFLKDPEYVNAKFNTLEPLALLALDAHLRDKKDEVPPHVGSRGYIHGSFDGHGRTYDSRVIWNQKRSVELYVDEELHGNSGQIGDPQLKDEAWHFDGEKDAIIFEDAPTAFDDNDQFSIAVTAKMFDNRRFLGAYRYHLRRTKFRTRGDDQLEVNLDIDDQKPHYIVITYDGTAEDGRRVLTGYVDGKKVDSDSTEGGSPLSSYEARNLNIGRTQHSEGVYSNVAIRGDVHVFNRVLSAEEIAELAPELDEF